MSAVVVVVGQVRDVRNRHRRSEPGQAPGEVWGRSVKVLTEAASIFGDTLDVTVFNSTPLDVAVGELIEWVVEVKSSQYGIEAVYKTSLALVGAGK